MSLRADDRYGRSKDKGSNRDRDRSRGDVRAPSPPSATDYRRRVSSAMPGAFEPDEPEPTYEVRAPASASKRASYAPPTNAMPSRYETSNAVPYPHDYDPRDHYAAQGRQNSNPSAVRFPSAPYMDSESDSEDDLAYGDHAPVARSRHASYTGAQSQYPGQRPGEKYVSQPDHDDPRISRSYSYAAPPDKITYSNKPQFAAPAVQYRSAEQVSTRDSLHRTYTDPGYRRDGAQVVEMVPSRNGREDRGPPTRESRHLSISTPGLGPPSSSGLGGRLSVSGLSGDHHTGNMPPPSPMMEAYRGTYQSVSPMALALRPHDDDSDLDSLDALDAPPSLIGKKGPSDKLSREAEAQRLKERGHDKEKDKSKSKSSDKKRVTVYNAEDDAKKLKSALGHSKVDTEAIIDTLPGLSHDQIWDLRKEYKKQVKIQGKGINLPKHLKMKLSGNFGKAVYVTGLGRWESEGYWANFWYQSHGSRRELLIESLMGRTNTEIRYIKDEFRDKRYSDSLTKCMEKELKMDKFRSAVMMVLEERRQDEQDVYPVEYRQRDVEILQRAMTSRQGGETAMLEVIIRRSDAHLREVMRLYQAVYKENFARLALQKSNNLVGEVVAHILNGVINRPARDAVLLNHAIRDIAAHNKEDDLRYELLISRVIRIHWDRVHLARVKREYQEKYGSHLQQDIEEATKGDFREFMCELCES